jgi:dienelactone hydrolase
MPKPDKDGDGVPQTQKKAFGGPYVTVKAQAIREVVDPVDQQKDIDAAISYVYGEPMVDKERIGIWGTSFDHL